MTDLETEAKPPLVNNKDRAVITSSINDVPWNRMSLEFMNRLEALVEDLDRDKSVRAVVISGKGDEHVSVGMHLKEMLGTVISRGDLEAILDQGQGL